MVRDGAEDVLGPAPMRVYTATTKRHGFEVVYFSYSRAAAIEQLRTDLPDVPGEEIRVASYFVVESRLLRTPRRKE